MDILQNVDLGVAALVLVGLCVIGVVLLLLLQVLGTVFGFLGSIVEIIGNILGGGPVAWCGCLLVLGGCAAVAILIALTVSMLSQCGTPEAVNFCKLFGM